MKILENLENVKEFISQLNNIIDNEKEWENRYKAKDMLYRDAFARWQFYMKGYKKLGGKDEFA